MVVKFATANMIINSGQLYPLTGRRMPRGEHPHDHSHISKDGSTSEAESQSAWIALYTSVIILIDKI